MTPRLSVTRRSRWSGRDRVRCYHRHLLSQIVYRRRRLDICCVLEGLDRLTVLEPEGTFAGVGIQPVVLVAGDLLDPLELATECLPHGLHACDAARHDLVVQRDDGLLREVLAHVGAGVRVRDGRVEFVGAEPIGASAKGGLWALDRLVIVQAVGSLSSQSAFCYYSRAHISQG